MIALTDATFYAPLKTTLVLTNGSGNPTFTRTSTKTVEDNEGDVKTLKSGAVGLAGARVVQNHFLNSNDMTAADWVANNITKASALDPDGAATGVLLTAVISAANHYYQKFTQSSMPGSCDTRTVKFLYYPGTAGWLRLMTYDGSGNQVRVWFNATSNVIGTANSSGSGFTYVSSSLDASTDYPGWYELSLIAEIPLTGTIYHQFNFQDGDGSTGTIGVAGKTLTLAFPQLENTTGQSDQTAGEYVSTGELSAPYHGGGADGVKYFDTDSSGVAIPDATMLGAQLDYASKTNSMLWCRDLTNAVWVKTNCTAAKTQTGVDGLDNACSLLTATSADATCLQTITTASTPACTGWKVKRSVGTGLIYITRDNGSNWTDITSLINSGTFTLTGIENTSVLNPVVGFKIATSGDAIIVDSGRNHSGTELCEDIFTTTAAVIRNAEVLTYQTSGNFSDTAGTILATIKRDNWANGNGSAVGKASFGLLTSASNSGVQAADGTNTVSGLAGTPVDQIKLGCRWSGSSLQAFYEDEYGAIGSYDGSFNLSTIAVMPGTQGYIRDLAIFNTSLADTDMPWYVAPIVVTATPAYGGGGSLPYSKTNKVPRPMATVMPNDDDEVLVVIQLFMESGCQ